MNELDQVAAPSHQQNEAPISAELRDKATENLETIKYLIEEARAAGNLSKEDEAVLRDWLTQDVQAPAQEAEQHDVERQAVLASNVVNTAVGGVHVNEDYTVSPQSEHERELVYRQVHGRPSSETSTNV